MNSKYFSSIRNGAVKEKGTGIPGSDKDEILSSNAQQTKRSSKDQELTWKDQKEMLESIQPYLWPSDRYGREVSFKFKV